MNDKIKSKSIRAPKPENEEPLQVTKESLEDDKVNPPEILASTRRCIGAMILKMVSFSVLYVIFFVAISYLLSFIPNTGAILTVLGISILVLEIVTIWVIYDAWRYSEYQIRENAFVSIRKFIFWKNENYYSFKPDFDFKVRQGLIGKLLGCGSIIMTGPLSVEEPVILKEVPNPDKYLKKLMTMINKMIEKQ
jgi:hypothetical protein